MVPCRGRDFVSGYPRADVFPGEAYRDLASPKIDADTVRVECRAR